MIKRSIFSISLPFILMLLCGPMIRTFGQTEGTSVKGVIVESGTGNAIKQVSISVLSTGVTSETDSLGAFTIQVPDLQAELMVELPGYVKRSIFLNGRESLQISLVPDLYKSFDNQVITPVGATSLKEAVNLISDVKASDFALAKITTYDQALQGAIPGMNVINQSGMPGARTMMNIRGLTSLFGANEPLLFIDGMIHDYYYAQHSLMEGFSLNPMDVVDPDDIVDISVSKDGLAYLGGAGSNGVININTEQKSEASTVIKISTYAGVSMMPSKLDVLNGPQFKTYFNEVLGAQGYTAGDINNMYPWLNGDASSSEYYRYNNNTDWQSEIFKPASMQKYHIFLKGGDDIATYNISTGYQIHKGIYENSRYSRFNLRINGKINITNKFSIVPNVKLSLADSYLPNQGPTVSRNPILSALLMPPLTQANARDESTGITLPYLDDVTVFNVSNPVAIVKNAMGSDRNYHFLSSVTASYQFNQHLSLTNLVGIDFNNARENIFLPRLGMVQIDSAKNSPQDLINEYRSTQNHTTLNYTTDLAGGHSIQAQAGFRYMENTYKYNKAIDLNTPNDDFRSLGQGSTYNYYRKTLGDNRGLLWTSYYGMVNYSYRDKYFLSTNFSYDGNSALNKENRFNFFPSVSAAWRLSSEKFLSNANWLEDLKLRGSWSVTGNMFSSIYDYSKLYYVSQRFGSEGVLTREVVPNKEMKLEKKTTIDAGLDISLLKQALNLHVDYFDATVNNMLIQQTLPVTYGYTNFFNNGGQLSSKGIEVAADFRLQAGSFVWTLFGTLSKQTVEITSLEFINPNEKFVLNKAEGDVQYISQVGGPLNAFYGYKTMGIFTDGGAASAVTGPNGRRMQAGDVIYEDLDHNNIIDKADMQVIGNPNPDLFGGFGTTFGYRGLQLSAVFNYSIGNEAFNYVRYMTESMDAYYNQSPEVLARYTGAGSTALPRASIGDLTGNTAFSDRWIEDASYVRLRQLTLSYDLPGIPGIYKGITAYITGTNLLTFTKYTGYNPDFQYLNSPFYMGADYGQIPQTKSFILGLKFDL